MAAEVEYTLRYFKREDAPILRQVVKMLDAISGGGRFGGATDIIEDCALELEGKIEEVNRRHRYMYCGEA